MGTRFAKADHEEEPRGKHSPVSLQYITNDVHNDDNLGMALDAPVQVSLWSRPAWV